MPDRAAIKRGFDFELDLAELLGLRLVPGSGNKWSALSDASGRLRVSAKSTSKRSWVETRRQLSEAIELAQGTGETPALAIEDEDGERLIIFRLMDFAELFAGDWQINVKPSKAEERRARAAIPALLRDE